MFFVVIHCDDERRRADEFSKTRKRSWTEASNVMLARGIIPTTHMYDFVTIT